MQTREDSVTWREEGRLTRDLGILGTMRCESPGFSCFALCIPDIELKEAGNIKMPMSVDQENSDKSLLFLAKGVTWQDKPFT